LRTQRVAGEGSWTAFKHASGRSNDVNAPDGTGYIAQLLDTEGNRVGMPTRSPERAGRRTQIAAGLNAIRADERKFKQILLNLLSNAVKFTP
jgi:signal transduction histidine kinase